MAAATPGFSGADLKNVVNEAALLGARKDKKQIEFEDFNTAIDKIRMGLKREDLVNEDEKK